MFKTIKLFILFDIFLKLSFKVTTIFTNVTRTTDNTSKSIYQKRFRKHQELDFYAKHDF